MIQTLRKLTALLLTLALTFALLPGELQAQAASDSDITGNVISTVGRGTKKSKPLRILAVGNSFSRDGLAYLYKAAESAGYYLTIGNLYIGACSLKTHEKNLRNDQSAYTYYKFSEETGGSESSMQKRSIAYALKDEQWDVITLQQASADSGIPDSYRTFSWRCKAEEETSAEASLLSAASGGATMTALSMTEENAEITDGDSSTEPVFSEPVFSEPEEDPAEPQEQEQEPEAPVSEPETSVPVPGENETGADNGPAEAPEAPAQEDGAAESDVPEDNQEAEEEADAPSDQVSLPVEQEEYTASTYSQSPDESKGENRRETQHITFGVASSGTGSTFSLEAQANTTLTYQSSDTKVAQVDTMGNVTLNGGGKAIITVTAAASEDYQAAVAKVTVTSNETSYMAQLEDELREVYANGTENWEGWGEKAADKVKFGWQLTWAYAKKNINSSFVQGYKSYNSDQSTMYNAILTTAQNVVLPSGLFDFLIPTGTAIQNARTSYAGDRLNRDGVHLTLGLGRYIAGVTWAAALGIDVNKVTYLPTGTNGVVEGELPMVRESVINAMNEPFASAKSKCTKTPKLSKPVPGAPVNVTEGIQLTWTEVAGAGGYRVYRKSGSSYKLLKDFSADDKAYIASTQKTKTGTVRTYRYTDTAVKNKSGTTYTYYVSNWYRFGAKEYVNGAKDATEVAGDLVETASGKVTQTRLAAPSKVAVKNTAKGVKVNWKAVSKATTYKIYRSTGGKKRTCIATVKSGTTSYTDSKVKSKNGTSYTYDVVPCTKYGEGLPSAKKTVTRLNAVTLKKLAKSGSKGLKLTWSRNKQATGYSIYRRVNGGSWSKVKTIGKNATVSYVDQTVKIGKTYSYRIYAYKGASSSPGSNTLKLNMK